MTGSAWQETDKGLIKRFSFSDFASALAFVNGVGKLAEQRQHHPDIALGWGYAEITLFTHSENAVTNKDHELAAAIDLLHDE